MVTSLNFIWPESRDQNLMNINLTNFDKNAECMIHALKNYLENVQTLPKKNKEFYCK